MNGQKHILIVEDDQFIRNSMLELVESVGCSAAAVGNGREAINYLNECSVLPNLILLDLMMPVMDGFEFRVEQQKDPKICGIPVVIMSADGHVADKQARTSAYDYLKKPFELESILAIVEKVCQSTPA